MVNDLKQRIVGGVVIVCVLAIFLPVLLHKPKTETPQSVPMTIPQPQTVSQLSLQLPAQQQAPAAPQQAVTTQQPTAAAKLAQAEQTVTHPQSHVQQPVKVATTHHVISKHKIVTTPKINTHILQAAVTTPTAWVVQLGSFSEKSNVQRLVKQLRQHGFDAYTRKDAHGNSSITQVFVGPEISRDTINTINNKLSKEFHLHGVVRKYHV